VGDPAPPALVLSIPDPAPPQWSGQLTPPRSRTAPPRVAPPRPALRSTLQRNLGQSSTLHYPFQATKKNKSQHQFSTPSNCKEIYDPLLSRFLLLLLFFFFFSFVILNLISYICTNQLQTHTNAFMQRKKC
jgi:hypothetical protein